MSNVIVIRVISKAGRSRVELSHDAPFKDLKEDLATRLTVEAASLQLFSDEKFTKRINGADTQSLKAIGFKNGDMVYIANQDTKYSAAVVPGGVAQPKMEEMKKQPSSDYTMIDTTAKPAGGAGAGAAQGSPSRASKHAPKPLTDDEVKKHHCSHGPNAKCVNCLGVTKENMKEETKKCKHGPHEKCVNCIQTQDPRLGELKHESFEHYLIEIKQKCKGKHKPDQKCQNCVPFQEFRYKVNYNCPNHKPFPEGMCNKCLPPAVVLNRQSFRHVDYVSFMNFNEMQSFVNFWQQESGCMEQRMAWLYGYYSEDPNFPDGVRVNVEALYEPPQIGEINGVQPLNDPNESKIDRIAEALSLEKVGWIFTSINQDTFLTSQEIRQVAKYQEQYKVDHPEGYKVSKFVTVVVKPKGDNQEIGIEAYMISDQCQALERDNVFGASESRKKMILREPGSDEMIPSVIMQGKTVKEFEPDFFIVSLGNGQPRTKKDYNILKNYDFVVRNRTSKVPTKKDMNDYIKRHKGETSQRKYACFSLLTFIAEALDLDTAMAIAQNVSEEKPLDPGLVELLESM